MQPHVEFDRLPASDEVRTTLAALVDHLARDLPRDEGLVMRVARWWTARRAHVRLELLERFPARDVMITFRMDGDVRLVITGHAAQPHAEVTLTVREQDFDDVVLILSAVPHDDTPSVATIDYSFRGREFVLVADHDGAQRGETGQALCLMTIDEAVLLRGRLRDGRRVQLPADTFEVGP